MACVPPLHTSSEQVQRVDTAGIRRSSPEVWRSTRCFCVFRLLVFQKHPAHAPRVLAPNKCSEEKLSIQLVVRVRADRNGASRTASSLRRTLQCCFGRSHKTSREGSLLRLRAGFYLHTLGDLSFVLLKNCRLLAVLATIGIKDVPPQLVQVIAGLGCEALGQFDY
jgi:hypothetical protein